MSRGELRPASIPVLIGRGIWILVAVSLSCLLAGLVAAIGFKAMTQGTDLLTELRALERLDLPTFIAGFGAGFIITQVAGLPAFAFAAIAAAQGWRGLMTFLFLGFALGLGVPLIYFGYDRIGPQEWPIFATSGVAGGFLYWLIAGSWIGRRRKAD